MKRTVVVLFMLLVSASLFAFTLSWEAKAGLGIASVYDFEGEYANCEKKALNSPYKNYSSLTPHVGADLFFNKGILQFGMTTDAMFVLSDTEDYFNGAGEVISITNGTYFMPIAGIGVKARLNIWFLRTYLGAEVTNYGPALLLGTGITIGKFVNSFNMIVATESAKRIYGIGEVENTTRAKAACFSLVASYKFD